MTMTYYTYQAARTEGPMKGPGGGNDMDFFSTRTLQCQRTTKNPQTAYHRQDIATYIASIKQPKTFHKTTCYATISYC